MGIAGKYVKTFTEANLACCVDISMDSDYQHKFFNVLEVGETVKMSSHWDGEEFEFDIHKGKDCEYAIIEQKSSYERMLKQPPRKFKIVPMKGKRIG